MFTLTERELRSAQASLYNGADSINSAVMRLHGTKYEKAANRLWDALSALNKRLINDINKK